MFPQKEKILVTGAGGLVGSYLLPQLEEGNCEFYATQRETKISSENANIIDTDLTNGCLFFEQLVKIKPSIIVNLAAYTDVDGCEKDRHRARILNADLLYTICQYLRKDKTSHLLHISTDYIFDGIEGQYSEDDTPNPINWYGETKLLGEKEIKASLDKEQWCVVRISTPFGLHDKKKTFPIFVISNISVRKPIKVLADQFTTPIYAKTLSKMLVELLERKTVGLMHLACRNGLSRYDQALKIARTFNLDSGLIDKIHMKDINWIADRPRYSTLNIDKADEILCNKPTSYEEDLNGLFTEIEEKHIT